MATTLRSATVRCPAGAVGGADERAWAVVELQGRLVLDQGRDSGDSMNGQHVGELTFEEGSPVLVVGFHRLEGKVAALERPLAVLETAKDAQGRPVAGELEVVGIARHKLEFTERPLPAAAAKRKKKHDAGGRLNNEGM